MSSKLTKDQKRKKKLAQKTKKLQMQSIHLYKWSMHACYTSDRWHNWRHNGPVFPLIIVRQNQGRYRAAYFAINLNLKGIEDASLYREMDRHELTNFLAKVNAHLTESDGDQLINVTEDFAYSILQEALNFAKQFNFHPHRDFKQATRILKPNFATLKDASTFPVKGGDAYGRPVCTFKTDVESLSEEQKKLIEQAGGLIAGEALTGLPEFHRYNPQNESPELYYDKEKYGPVYEGGIDRYATMLLEEFYKNREEFSVRPFLFVFIHQCLYIYKTTPRTLSEADFYYLASHIMPLKLAEDLTPAVAAYAWQELHIFYSWLQSSFSSDEKTDEELDNITETLEDKRHRNAFIVNCCTRGKLNAPAIAMAISAAAADILDEQTVKTMIDLYSRNPEIFHDAKRAAALWKSESGQSSSDETTPKENAIAFSVQNTQGQDFFLKSSTSKNGQTRYYFVKELKADDQPVLEIPNGYVINEASNGKLTLKKS